VEARGKDKVYWHEAFYEAIQLELHQYLDVLTFINEHPLSKEALIIDVLVIKKKQGIDIDKNIGKIFRDINLLEFKSETDSLTVRDYNKVIAYGYLYASFAPVHISDISITFACTIYPRDLLDYLENDRRFKVTYSEDGICYIHGDTFPIQILESKRMSTEKNVFLKNLRSNLDITEAERTVKAYKALKGFESRNVYLDRLAKANPDIFKEMMKLIDAEFRELIVMTIAETEGILDERDKQRDRQRDKQRDKEMAKRLKQNDVPLNIIVNSTKLSLEEVEAL